MMIKQLNKPHVLLFLHQIPGSYMKQVSFVHEMRMVSSSRTPQERRSLSPENGTICFRLRELH